MISILKFIIYYLAINLLSFFIMVADKKKAIKQKYRISEKFIFTLAFLGGSLGVYLAMYYARHKTKHLSFTLGIPLTFIANLVTIYLLIFNRIIIF